jgi:alkanesulfonate monooxygenase SsuD/methylene tetrahydromethanopterin reductase-like flavin-dependent oxidoreductase (luciferase family)/FAD/FMN-containing dehydrogenase
MSDYGHNLRFGTFITPSAQRVDDVVMLAQETEAHGLDLGTFQDHPYQSNFVDTWTLLSYVAAKTSRVSLSGNVLNLPLRQPAVLARAVASLDLLTQGRVELGLGAGAFWDGIEAMGGEKLTPGQAVDALEEAMDIIRGIWDAGEAGGVRLDGTYHKARGARRGPLPHHPVGIWLGAYKPRMLRLVGRKADGWLPSLGYIKSPTMAESNAIIDAAAVEAGRDPRDIRRLLNISGRLATPEDVAEMVDQLVGLALEHGFSTFILPADSSGPIALFGDEVAPAVRAKVETARAARGTAAAPGRTSAAMAKRRIGIDYDAIPASLAERVVEPGDHDFPKFRSTYLYRGNPGLVLRPRTAEEVSAATAYAARQDVALAVRSGGHGISGRATNDGGIVLDLGQMNEIRLLDARTGLFRVGAGARWGDVATALAPHGLGMGSGDYGDVGVGGLATAGGIGWFSRKHGLTLDHVKAAEIVLADGRLVRADKDSHEDLFWAIRGAGANFGAVTALELEAYPVGNVVFAQLTYDLSDARAVLPRWAEAVVSAPRELTSFLTMVPARSGNPAIGQASIVIANPDPTIAEPMLQPFLSVGPVLGGQAYIIPYTGLVETNFSGHDGSGDFVSRAGLVTELTPDLAGAIGEILRGKATNMMQLRAVGGAVNDVPVDATAYAHRHQNFSLNASEFGNTAHRLESLWPIVEPYLDGLYLNFETSRDRAQLDRAFPGETLQKLRLLKAEYDPGQLFGTNFPIPPAQADAVAPNSDDAQVLAG